MAEPRQAYGRILSLDGGGTWAMIQVRVLIDFFGPEASGHDVLRHFDLVVANSGGSVVAGGLAVNKRLSEILDPFASEAARRKIFRDTPFQALLPSAIGHGLPIPRYSTTAKYAGLRELLGPSSEAPLTTFRSTPDLPHLLITAFDYDVLRAAFFRTDVGSLAATSASTPPATATLLDAVAASANPPVVFFDAPTQLETPNGPRRYWDGGVAGDNNPTLAGVVEALANGVPRDSIHVLSLGTGTVRRPPRPPGVPLSDLRFVGGDPPGLLADFKKLGAAILDDPPDAASFTAHVALDGKIPRSGERVDDGPIVRMSPVVRPVRSGDTWSWPPALSDPQWEALTTIELDAVTPAEVDRITSLCDAWMRSGTPNQPIRANARLEADIGHDTYLDAKASARVWL